MLSDLESTEVANFGGGAFIRYGFVITILILYLPPSSKLGLGVNSADLEIDGGRRIFSITGY